MTTGGYLNLSSDDLDLLTEVLADAVAASDGDWPTDRLAAVQGDDRALYLTAGVLDHIDCTEHGGNIIGAWATDKGRRLLAILNRYAESDYEATPCTDLTTKGPT